MEKKGLSVVLMVALLATSFLELHARVDLFNAFTAGVGLGEDETCCNKCSCLPNDSTVCVCIRVQQDSCPTPCQSPCICKESTSASASATASSTCGCAVIQNNCDNVCTTTGIEKYGGSSN